jgi:molybdenum cofactor guanylyltransferase
MVRRAAIVLAGGRGARFQNKKVWHDKVLAPLLGKPLLIRAIENVRKAVDEIIVCVNEQKRKERYAQILKAYGIADVQLVVDEKIDNLGGPLVAIFTGLKHVDADYCLTLPGDMPLVQPKVTKYMFDKALDSRVVVPMWPNGRLETLIMVLEKCSALEIADTLTQLGRPRSDDLIRGALNVTFASIVGEISTVDPELKSFVNINFPEDLTRLQPRGAGGETTQNLHINKGALPITELRELRKAVSLCRESNISEAAKIFSANATSLDKQGSFFWAAISRENEAKNLRNMSKHQVQSTLVSESRAAFLKAADTYGMEAKMHQDCGCFFLANRAISDKAWCESRADELK